MSPICSATENGGTLGLVKIRVGAEANEILGTTILAPMR
jgi:hypothetical protein